MKPLKSQWAVYEERDNREGRRTLSPTLLLRLIVPHTGFTVIVRALLDTGCSYSFLSFALSSLLFREVGPYFRYCWPSTSRLLIGKPRTLYRSLLGLQLQSLDRQCPVTLDLTEHPFQVEERKINWWAQSSEPLNEIASKLAELGLPLITRSSVPEGERTMWTTEKW